MLFYVGLHQPSDARHFERAFVSINRVRGRKKPVECPDWILDSGAFTEISTHGAYRSAPAQYAADVERLADLNPGMQLAVSQDWMCEPHILQRTGLDIAEHQRRTVERYDILSRLVQTVYVMPVLQGYAPADYVAHVRQYGTRLGPMAYVGVGSVCKRNGDPRQIEAVLTAIKAVRPDLQLHGFGLKTIALASPLVRKCLFSADSMAWSFAARRRGRNANDWREARAFVEQIKTSAAGEIQ